MVACLGIGVGLVGVGLVSRVKWLVETRLVSGMDELELVFLVEQLELVFLVEGLLDIPCVHEHNNNAFSVESML